MAGQGGSDTPKLQSNIMHATLRDGDIGRIHAEYMVLCKVVLDAGNWIIDKV